MQTNIESNIQSAIQEALQALYTLDVEAEKIPIQSTKKEFEGHYTLVVFPYVKEARKAPEAVAQEIGSYLVEKHNDVVVKFNVVKGFLNMVLSHKIFVDLLNYVIKDESFGITPVKVGAPLYMVEYSSPNTNKPLHLGHVRNNLLGYSLSKILEANGKKVVKTNIVNDRGIHICKSMLAWQKWGEGATPESTGKKGDHLVGDFYVLFDKKYREELKELKAQGMSDEEAEQASTLMKEARQMLKHWEEGNMNVLSIWKMMNEWVYDGFAETYDRLGVGFDKIYYESDTYLVGKKEVQRGVKEGLFVTDPDGSVWADLTPEGLDRKILLRADGTSVYMTQDIGTAKMRYNDYDIDKMIYVVGNEQNYHFQVLSILLDKLGFEFGKDLQHFSYGMVELPNGKMKSREGTVVDADDLMDEMENGAYKVASEHTRAGEMSEEEMREVARKVGLGALKYFLLKVDPKKNMMFDPEESIDFNGNTGPFLQYTYARIRSIERKAKELGIKGMSDSMVDDEEWNLSDKELSLVQRINEFPAVVREAGNAFSPAMIANYVYDLVKEYNQFYHDHSILNETDERQRSLRLSISSATAGVIKRGLALLGIEVPERM